MGFYPMMKSPAVQELRILRDQLAHSPDVSITMTDALRYHSIADALVKKLKSGAT